MSPQHLFSILYEQGILLGPNMKPIHALRSSRLPEFCAHPFFYCNHNLHIGHDLKEKKAVALIFWALITYCVTCIS
jgi:hypothetical protein